MGVTDSMKSSFEKKSWAFAIIVLFFGISIIPSMVADRPVFIETIYVDDDGGTDCISIKQFGNVEKRNIIISDGQTDFYGKYFQSNHFCYPSIWPEMNNHSCTIYADGICFTHPLNNDIFRAGDIIYINGTIGIEGLKQYKVEYGQGKIPIKWYTKGITLVNNGSSPIIDNTVAIWDTSSIEKPDFFTLRITTYRKSILKLPYFLINNLFHSKNKILSLFFDEICNVEDRCIGRKKMNYIKNLYLDPTLKEGWPKRIPWYHEDDENVVYFGGAAQPVLSNIDNDNESEILVYVAGNPTRIYAFNPDGTEVDGWPVYVDQERMPGGDLEAPAVGDLDNDGWKEIIVNGFMGLYAYNHDGSFRFNISFVDLCGKSFRPLNVPSSVVLFDLDNDGTLEIIKKFMSHDDGYEKVVVFNSTGEILDGWPQNIYQYMGLNGDNHIETISFGLTQSIGNFDEDDEWEIVVGTVRNEYADIDNPNETFHHEGRVFVFNLDGSILDGFPVDIDGEIAFSSPVVADIDNDGYEDIIIGTKMEDSLPEKEYSNPNTGLYIIDRFGNVKSGWPRLIGESIYTTPAIADFNNDGFPEIVVSTMDDNWFDWNKPKTYIFDFQGNILPGWPQETIWNDYHSPAIGDVNCDGSPDVVVSAGNGIITPDGKQPGLGGVYAWNIDGSMINGFPKVTEVDAQASPSIADIDNDGIVEVVASSMYDMDIETEGRKQRSSIYVWEVGSLFDVSSLEWPMYSHDSGYSGRYIKRNGDR